MERPRPPSIAQEYANLETRFKKAAIIPKRLDPQGRNKVRNVNSRDLDYLPAYRIKGADLPGIETFVLMLEKIKSFKLAEKNSSAERMLGQALNLARQLDYELPGNDGAVKFFYEGSKYIEEVNPQLAEDVARVITKAWDEKRFERQKPQVTIS